MRRKLAFYIIFAIFFLFSLILQFLSYKEQIYIIQYNITNNISCHYLIDNDALSSTFSLPEKNIFFHETSCRGGLNSRQACAVESAAKMHPLWQINVFFSSPVSSHNLKRTVLKQLKKIRNVKLIRLHINEYSRGTPLEDLIVRGTLRNSSWRVEHTSDVLRFLTLYKFGGVYLDTDTVVVKSFETLPSNWAGVEMGDVINNAVLSLSEDAVGRDVSEETVSEIKRDYKPNEWGYNGPLLVTRVLKQICSTKDIGDRDSRNCSGFHIFGSKYFYPVNYNIKEVYFNPGVMVDDEVTYVHHIWNKLTNNLKVHEESPYAALAKKFCPITYRVFSENFGN